MPRITPLLAAAVVLAITVVPAGAQDAAAPPFDHVRGGNVTPPGNNGHVPSTQTAAAIAGTYAPPNMTDQRDLYVDWGRKDWSFTTPEELGDAFHPAGREDVSIAFDDWGVPTIVGETDAAAQFGVGYAMASQRLFQADIFRHVARGEMAEFIGGQEWYDYDRAWRAEFYTDAELLEQFERFYTAEERALVQAYLDGINAYIDEALRDPQKLPGEYVALGIVPEKWELRHALAIFVLQARDSVEGFGTELYNATLLQDLERRLGRAEARQVFQDLRFYRDPGAYTTAPPEEGRFPYPGGGFEGFDAPGVALPDPAGVEAVREREHTVARALALVGLARKQASNAIAVSPRLTSDGDALLLGGPQLAYLVPGIFWEFEVHSPRQHARGIGFAGTAGVVLIGKTPTHAWSITYGYTDQIDVFLVPLDPQQPETHYLRDGESEPMETYDTTVTCKVDQVGFLSSPAASDLCDGAPADQTVVTVRRIPEYGPVTGTVDVDGQPHAVVKTRGHWMREIQNGRPFMTFNQATTMERFRAAQRDFNISLNINYVDDEGHAGFWHVASPPIRAEGTDVRLPTIGDGSHDWQGYVPFDDIPHAIDPEQGFTANWNNQISTGWHNGDQNYWADVQRVDMLARRMERLAKRGDITPEDLWRVNREAAFEDARVHPLRPLLAAAYAEGAPADSTVGGALDEVLSWNGQRTASQNDGGTWLYDDAAVVIWDRFFAKLQDAVLADELGEAYYDDLMADLEVDFYYLTWPIITRVLLGEDAPLEPRHDWLDGTRRDEAIRTAFAEAAAELEEEFGGEPSTWRGEAVLTTYMAVGLGSVEPHPFMNRGTYNELAIVDVQSAPTAATPAAAPGDLPTTGAGLGAAALLVLAAARRRRPRPAGRG